MKKTIAIILILFILCYAVGCAGSQNVGPLNSDSRQSAETSETASESDTVTSPEPTDNPMAAEALHIAKEHGLSEHNLHGEYELFIRFAETVEANSDLGRYKEFMYRIFPVVAAAASDYMDYDYFFNRLSELSFTDGGIESVFAGMYTNVENRVYINSETDPEFSYCVKWKGKKNI